MQQLLDIVFKRKIKFTNACEFISSNLEIGLSLKDACEVAYREFPVDEIKYMDDNYIMKYITSFEDVCYVLNINPNSVLIEGLTVSEIASRKLLKTIKVLNNGWVEDFNDANQYKFVPYFKQNKNGSFSYRNFFLWNANSSVGFGWGFKEMKLMEHGIKHFMSEYNDWLQKK